jgi:predicted Fe-Mo cluster-binding NifX family protein
LERCIVKVAVTSVGPSLDASLDPRFGRCPTFVLVETDDMTFEVVENGDRARAGGAGIQAAQLMAQKNVKAVLTGNCGPNAHETLSAAGIDVFVGCSGTVTSVVAQFQSGTLRCATAASVAEHAGMKGGDR